MFWLGVSPCGRAYFLLLRQKKVAKEKATPGYAVGVANFPALLEIGGGCGTRATPSNSPRPFSAAFSVARRSTRGPKGGMAEPISARMDCYGQPGKNPKNPSQSWPRTPLGPLGGAEQRRNAGGLRFAMFEPQASSGKPPGVSSSARNRRSRHRPRGRLFFAYFLLAKQKKVRRPQAEHQANKPAPNRSVRLPMPSIAPPPPLPADNNEKLVKSMAFRLTECVR